MKIQGLRILAEDLVERGLLLETRPPITRRAGRETSIEVGDTSPLGGDKFYEESSAAYYLEVVRQDRLSWLLFDASVVQINYRIRGEAITFHRYCYIPAPFRVDLRGSAGASIGDLIEGAVDAEPLRSPRRSPMRFEFDPAAQREQHAAAHLHVNSVDCRIPMRGPLSVKEFISFLVTFLYTSSFNPQICGDLQFEYDPTITEDEQRGFHLNWRRVIAAAVAGEP